MVSSDRVKRVRRKKRPAAVYQYQKDSRYFAQIADSLKEAGAKELAELGAEDIKPEFRGIYFRADKSTLYRINYLTRLLSRCLAPLISYRLPRYRHAVSEGQADRVGRFFCAGQYICRIGECFRQRDFAFKVRCPAP